MKLSTISFNWRKLLVVYVIGLIPICLGTYMYAERAMNIKLENDRALLSSTLASSLEFYQFVPSLLSQSSLLRNTLVTGAPDVVSQLNRRFADTNANLGSDAIYLMDRLGNTVAASNFEQDNSFVGDNYAFRPYFISALTGQSAYYLALGVKSGKRGYYFAEPVYDLQQVMGVVVVKVSLNHIEQIWRSRDTQFVIYDTDGIIFFSSEDSWRYASMFEQRQDALEQLKSTQRYAWQELRVLTTLQSLNDLESGSITLAGSEAASRWQLSQHYVPEWELNVGTLLPRKSLYKGIVPMVLVYSFALMSYWFFALYMRKSRELKRHQENMHIHLERRVEMLAGDLQSSNNKLQDSLHQQQAAYAALEQAQHELVQTAKLAVLGEFSASLHHELAQPLQALHTYSDNAKRLLKRNQLQGLSGTIEEIQSVTQTMVNITKQFKVFARKTSPHPRPISFNEILQGTRAIVQPKIDKHHIQFETPDEPSEIYCEPAHVEQVLVNLISNAIHALRHTDEPRIELTATTQAPVLLIRVSDNGPGVDDTVLSHLFEPFYTTRESGLGLGLAISKRIVEGLNGTISVERAETGGLVFSIRLPLYEQQRNN